VAAFAAKRTSGENIAARQVFSISMITGPCLLRASVGPAFENPRIFVSMKLFASSTALQCERSVRVDAPKRQRQQCRPQELFNSLDHFFSLNEALLLSWSISWSHSRFLVLCFVWSLVGLICTVEEVAELLVIDVT
jgi:hypothetical protein